MKTLLLFAVCFASASTVLAQPREGLGTELSISATYQNYSSGSSSSSTGAFLLCPRVGIFVARGLEFEPELALMLTSYDNTYMLNGNVSYNFISTGKSVPFILAGYGVANTVPMFNVPLYKINFGVGVLNFGFGIKSYFREDIAIRFEYRYQQFSGEGSSYNYGYYSYTEKVDSRIHTVQLGFSILL